MSAVLVLFGVIFAAAGAMNKDAAVAVNADTNWGLSFNTSSGIPSGNATAEKLKEFNACYLGDTSEKKIYLTFDAGYENGQTEKILDTLKKHNVRAVFFLVGNFLKTSPDIVKRMPKRDRRT